MPLNTRNRAKKRCFCCQDSLSLPAKRTNTKRRKLLALMANKCLKPELNMTARIKGLAAAVHCVVLMERIDLSKWNVGRRVKTQGVENGSVESNEKSLEGESNEPESATEDDDRFTGGTDSIQNVVEEIDAVEETDDIKEMNIAEEGYDIEDTDVVEVMDDIEDTDVVEVMDNIEETNVAEEGYDIEDTDFVEVMDEIEDTDVVEVMDDIEETNVVAVTDDVEETNVAEEGYDIEDTDLVEVTEDVEVIDYVVENTDVVEDTDCVEETNVVEASDIIEIIDDVEETNVNEKTNVVEKMNAVVDKDLITQRLNYLSKVVVYLESVENERAHAIFPNYSPKIVDCMRNFFLDPEITMLPFAKTELLTKDHLLLLMENTSKWMNCATMNSYFDLIEKASNGRIVCYKSYYIQPRDEERLVEFRIPPNLIDTAFFSREMVFIPYNLAKIHWVLVTVNFAAKSVFVYDSLDLCINKYQEHMEFVLNELLEHLSEEANYHMAGVEFDIVEWTAAVINCPRQRNNNDCGYFVCNMAWCLVQGMCFNFQQEDIPLVRQRMVHEFIHGRLQ